MLDEGRIIKGGERDEDENRDEKYINIVLERTVWVIGWKTKKNETVSPIKSKKSPIATPLNWYSSIKSQRDTSLSFQN